MKITNFEELVQFKNSSEFKKANELLNLKTRLEESEFSNPLSKENFELGLKLIQELTAKYDELKAILNQASTLKNTALKDLETKKVALHNSQVLFQFYQSVLDALSREYLDSVSGMLSDVYAKVFENPNKRVVLTMEVYRGRQVIKLNLINNVDGHDYIESMDNDGGSAQIILGLIVSIYFILTTGLPRIIFIDESLSALSTGTLHRFLQVLRAFVDDLDFVFVIVEHAAYRLRGQVDKIYLVESGTYEEIADSDAIDNFMDKVQEGSM
jgi:hypothetical protein